MGTLKPYCLGPWSLRVCKIAFFGVPARKSTDHALPPEARRRFREAVRPPMMEGGVSGFTVT